MKTELRRVTWMLALSTLLAPLAIAQGVRIVCPLGDQNFPDIASAVAAAQEGDVLLVGEGTYGGFTIDGKSLAILAAPGALVTVLDDGSVVVAIENLAVDQTVLLSGLEIVGAHYPGLGLGLLRVENALGSVRLQDCALGRDGYGWHPCEDGNAAAEVTDSPRVAFLNCEFWGGDPGMAIFCCGGPEAVGDGGSGLLARSSRVALYDCRLVGGDGADVDEDTYFNCLEDPGDGGHGAVLIGSEVFASGSRFLRGWEGYTKHGAVSGVRGHAATIDASSVLTLLDCPLGGDLAGSGQVITYPGSSGSIEAPALVPESGPVDLTLTGTRGDRVWLVRTPTLGYRPFPPFQGVWLVDVSIPVELLITPLTQLPASGTATLQLPGTTVPLGATHRAEVLQELFLPRADVVCSLGTARHVLGLSLTVGPDCNGNGISDFVDVLFGAAPDLDHDLIPDSCPGG